MIFKKQLVSISKKIIQNIFKFFYGNINSVLQPNNEKDLKIKQTIIEGTNYKVFFCKNSRLYTDTIHDTAIIKNNSIVEGPSFQYRNNKNASCVFNSVFNKGTPRFKKRIRGQVFSLLTGGGGNSNYWHWLFDVLPRLNIIKNLINQTTLDYYLFPSLDKKFQRQTLDILNIPNEKRISSKSFRHFSAEEIVITSHPYTLLNDPSLDSLRIPLWISKYLRSEFLNSSIKKTKIKTFPKKIYINRKDATSLRYIINLDEVENILSKFGFESFTMSNLNFSDQVAMFYNANEIIGLHGAGFANIIFCKQKSKIIEMRSNTTGDVIKNLAINNNLNYYDISVKPKTINLNNQAGDIEIDLNILKNKLNENN